jgi:hypothetical protein
MIRVSTLALLLACRTTHSDAPPAPSPVAQPPQPAGTDGLRVRAAPDHDQPIDATVDQEMRGGRPSWTAPPALVAGIRVTLESLAPAARRCFAAVLAPTVGVRLVVSEHGRADDVIVESENPRPRDCLADAIRRARFPASHRPWRVEYIFRP